MKKRQTCHSQKRPLPPYSFTGSRCPTGGLWAPTSTPEAPQFFHERDLMPPYAEQYTSWEPAEKQGEEESRGIDNNLKDDRQGVEDLH